MSNENLLHGQSMAIQWVVFALTQINKDINDNNCEITKLLLERATSVEGVDDYKALEIGCVYSSNFILPFAIELGFKSLLVKNGISYGKVHKLIYLYDLLPEEIRNRIEDKMANMGKFDIKNILSNHDNDFVEWRYLENTEQLNTDIRKLQMVLCTILDVYEEK